MQEMQELKEIIENGRINLLPAERVAENILAAGYRQTFASDLASVTQKAYKEGYEKARKETAQEIFNDIFALINNAKDKSSKIFGNSSDYGKGYKNSVSHFNEHILELAKQYGVEVEE